MFFGGANALLLMSDIASSFIVVLLGSLACRAQILRVGL